MTAAQQASGTLTNIPEYVFARAVGDTLMVHQSGDVEDESELMEGVWRVVHAGGGQLVEEFTIPDPEWSSGWVTVREYRLSMAEEMAA